MIDLTGEERALIKPWNKKLTMETPSDVQKWLSGINPHTGREILLWGPTWMRIMEENGWFDWVTPEVSTPRQETIKKYHPSYLKHWYGDRE